MKDLRPSVDESSRSDAGNAVQRKEQRFVACVESIEHVILFVNEELKSARCPQIAMIQIDTAIDELFGNIAHYAYGGEKGEAVVRIEIDQKEPSATISFLDRGVPFNPLNAKTPDVTLPPKERKKGGLGIYLVKKTMDDVSYEYKDGQNILTMKKLLGTS